jgi:hypothetical protein
MSTEHPKVKHSQSLKKYKAESRPEVLAFVREWARGKSLDAVYEDASVLKVTGTQEQITELRATLKEKFGWEPLAASG